MGEQGLVIRSFAEDVRPFTASRPCAVRALISGVSALGIASTFHAAPLRTLALRWQCPSRPPRGAASRLAFKEVAGEPDHLPAPYAEYEAALLLVDPLHVLVGGQAGDP